MFLSQLLAVGTTFTEVSKHWNKTATPECWSEFRSRKVMRHKAFLELDKRQASRLLLTLVLLMLTAIITLLFFLVEIYLF